MSTARRHVFVIFLLLPLFIFSQQPSPGEETLRWKPNQRLTWSDYKGRPDASSDAAASTTTYLGIDYRMTEREFHYTITCSFSRTRSWGRHQNDRILRHEQGHFDIAEIFARQLQKKMKEYKYDPSNYKTELRRIYQSVVSEKETMQTRYDEETDHSIDEKKQADWLLKIDGMLKELNDYADY